MAVIQFLAGTSSALALRAQGALLPGEGGGEQVGKQAGATMLDDDSNAGLPPLAAPVSIFGVDGGAQRLPT